jgi:hypothetical protein
VFAASPTTSAPDRLQRDGLLDGPVERRRRARIGERAGDVTARRAAARPDDDHRDALPGKAIVHQYRVGGLHERHRRACPCCAISPFSALN